MRDLLQPYIDQKLIYEQVHPSGDLFIYNYAPTVQYGKLWDEITTQCRGLILGMAMLDINEMTGWGHRTARIIESLYIDPAGEKDIAARLTLSDILSEKWKVSVVAFPPAKKKNSRKIGK